MKVSETLNKAADLIEERGWAQGDWGWGDEGRICLEGGILAALGLSPDVETRPWFGGKCPAFDAVCDYLQIGDAGEFDMPWRWNDHYSRTSSEVIETLRACAVIEEAREQQDAAFETYKENVEAAR